MRLQPVHINLALAWLWVVLGFASGFALGLHFHKDHWLGGYGSLKRRLYRLAHISFFGLAAANLMFYFTAQEWAAGGCLVTVASWSFVAGAVSMPLCCVLMAHFPQCRLLFVVPVVSLLIAGCLTLWEVIQP